MGRGAVRAGPPIQGTVANSGTDGSQTDPRIILFAGVVRPAFIMNATGNGNVIRVKVNTETEGTVSNDFDNDGDDDGWGHFSVCDDGTLDLSVLGGLCIESISYITTDAGDDLDNVSVVGWRV